MLTEGDDKFFIPGKLIKLKEHTEVYDGIHPGEQVFVLGINYRGGTVLTKLGNVVEGCCNRFWEEVDLFE